MIYLKKISKLAIISILITALIGAGINLYIVNLSYKHISMPADTTLATYDAIIVPGARVYANRPSLMLKDRLDTAISLYFAGYSNKILVSGDHGRKTYDEVNIMRDYLLDHNIPEKDIFMDHAGFDTYSTLFRARDIFLVESALISTQKYHLYRCVYMGNKLGIKTDGIICDNFLPKYMIKNDIRESLARIKAFMFIEILKPKPKYLGNIIPITGSGLETKD